MIQRSSIVIDPQKSRDFIRFLNDSAKNKEFWKKIKEGASVKVDKKKLNQLFEKQ